MIDPRLIEYVEMECQECALEFDARSFTDPGTGQSEFIEDSEKCPRCRSKHTVETR